MVHLFPFSSLFTSDKIVNLFVVNFTSIQLLLKALKFLFLSYDILKNLDFIKAISTPFFQLIYWTKFIKVGETKHISRHIKGKGIIISNHVSYVDALVIYMQHLSRRPRIVIGKDMLSIIRPVFARACTSARVIPIARNGENDVDGINLLNAVLSSNGLVAIFPEGHVNNHDNIDKFMEGTALFALLNKALIYPRVFLNKPKPFHINYVVIGEPIDLNSYFTDRLIINADTLAKANNILYEKVNFLYNKGNQLRRER